MTGCVARCWSITQPLQLRTTLPPPFREEPSILHNWFRDLTTGYPILSQPCRSATQSALTCTIVQAVGSLCQEGFQVTNHDSAEFTDVHDAHLCRWLPWCSGHSCMESRPEGSGCTMDSREQENAGNGSSLPEMRRLRVQSLVGATASFCFSGRAGFRAEGRGYPSHPAASRDFSESRAPRFCRSGDSCRWACTTVGGLDPDISSS